MGILLFLDPWIPPLNEHQFSVSFKIEYFLASPRAGGRAGELTVRDCIAVASATVAIALLLVVDFTPACMAWLAFHFRAWISLFLLELYPAANLLEPYIFDCGK